MGVLRSVSRTKCSAAICLIDAFTGLPPATSDIEVTPADMPAKPIRKPGGIYIFTDLPNGSWTFIIRSPYYFEAQAEFGVELRGAQNPVTYVQLLPNRAYPFPDGATLLAGPLRDKKGEPLKDARIQAVIAAEECARARLAQSKAVKGAQELTLGSLLGRIAPGDVFKLANKSGDRSELCRVAEAADHGKRIVLQDPLKGNYAAGALLLPVSFGASDSRGEAIVAIRPQLTAVFQCELEAESKMSKININLVCNEGIINHFVE